ncbi:hypothetical protein Tco_0896796 [Tanacetum coccineum]
MVAYLKKPTGSKGFQEIVYFLNGSHIRFALIKNPTIYVSIIKKFWQTATVRTIDNGEQEITAIVDGNEFTITEASLPQTSVPIPNVADEVVFKEWDDIVVRATTTAASLDEASASEAMGGSIAQTRSERVPTLPYDSPLLRVNTLGSDEGSMTLLELMVLCTTLSKKVESLEADLKQTKKVYGAAYTKLIKRVKKLEKTIKSNQARRRSKIVVLDDEEDLEDSSKQGRVIEEIDQDARITLVTHTKDTSQEDQPEDQLGVLSAAKVLADATKKNVNTYARRRRAVSTGSGEVSTTSRLFSTAEESVSTTGASTPGSTVSMVQEVNISIPSPVVVKDKGKGIMTDSEDEQTKRTKLQQEQDRLGHEAAEEWENIRARVEANEELTQRIQPEERNKYNEVDQANMLVDLINQRKRYFAAQKVEAKRNKPMTQTQQRNYMMNYIKHMGSSKKQKTNEALELVQEQPDEEEKELPQEDLQQMMMIQSCQIRMNRGLHTRRTYVEAASSAHPSDYVHGPEEPEQAPPSPDYVPGLEHSDDNIVAEDQPYAEDASPTAQSPGYDPVDYPADGGDDGDDEDEPSEEDEDDDVDIEADEDEKDEDDDVNIEPSEHPAPADSAAVALPAADQAPSAEETELFETDESAATPPPHPAYRVTARISIPAPVPTPVWSDAEVDRILAISTPLSSPLSPWSSPLPQIPSPPLPSIPSPSLPVSPPLLVSSPVPVLSPSPPASPIHAPSSGIPPPLPISVPTSSPPLLLPSTSCREDRPEVTLPPRKRLGITLGPRYEVGESSSVAAARPDGGLRADYGFVATIDREIRHDPERDVGYGITDSWDEIVETF